MESQVVRVEEKTRLEEDDCGNISSTTWQELIDCPDEISQEMADHLWHEHGIGQEKLDENNVKVVEKEEA